MLATDLMLMLTVAAQGAISTWLPVREWVRGPIPGQDISSHALRVAEYYDTESDSFQWLKSNDMSMHVRTSIDEHELTIQIIQHEALNVLSEDCLSRSLQSPHIHPYHPYCHSPFFQQHYNGREQHELKKHYPPCHPSITSSLNMVSPHSFGVFKNLDPLLKQHHVLPQAHHDQQSHRSTDPSEITSTYLQADGNHLHATILATILRTAPSDLTPSVYITPVVQSKATPSALHDSIEDRITGRLITQPLGCFKFSDNGEIECRSTQESIIQRPLIDIIWCLTSLTTSQRRSCQDGGYFWFSGQRGVKHLLIYADYRGQSKRALKAMMEVVNLSRISTMSTCMISSLCRPLVDGLTLIVGYPTLILSSIPKPILIFCAIALIPVTNCAGDDDDSKIKLPPFDGVIANFTSWLISFSAWVAWKKPELMELLNGTQDAPPSPVNPDAPTAAERKRSKEWSLYNTQLYGAIVTHVTPPIQASLHVNSTGNGVKALIYLKKRYGSQSTGDRAEATLRLQKSYIDSRAKISAEDVIRQYNEMSFAADDIVAAGGTRPDDILLISMFENSLPPAYSMIRQMIRYTKHDTFDAYYNDLLSQVKAEYRVNEARSSAGAFSTYSKGDRGKGKGFGSKGKGKGKGVGKGKGGRGRGDSYSYQWSSSYINPCFNCSSTDHLRESCPNQPVRCKHCGANHMDELCPRGPGGPLRDGLSPSAYDILDKQCNRAQGGKKRGYDDSSAHTSSSTSSAVDVTDEVLRRAYLLGRSSTQPHTSTDLGQSSNQPVVSTTHPNTSSAQSARQSFHHTQHAASSSLGTNVSTGRSDLDEIDKWLEQASRRWAHMAYGADKHIRPPSPMSSRGVIAYVDSQATNFVVPSIDYLSSVTEYNPSIGIDTANGRVQPEAVGVMDFNISDDQGHWHHFTISDVWALPTCDRVLYSQRRMHELGVQHHLDEGYLVMPNGAHRSISSQSYALEITLGTISHATAYSSSSLPLLRSASSSHNKPQRGRGADSKAQVPQALVWQRLGFPSKHTWLHTMEAVIDHGLPDQVHLKHDFRVPEAVVAARSRLLPFHSSREADSLPAPGAVIYMDFAGPMIESYPHKFKHYCGAIDAGSGYSRLLACHSPDKETSRQCLELLLADLKMLMGVSHRLSPQVVVSDQGSQFMSHFFRDFLSSEQIRHWPSVVYTPQQNAMVERMWGVRFGIARTLLKFSGLGPSWHPFALQTSNWISNRLPQASRNNLSPWFILSKLRASIAYLRSFGCLTRFVIPHAHRTGDRHFADRGAIGIYLGPSEVSPGCIVYCPSLRRIFTTRNVICFEDVHPGVKGCGEDWPNALETQTPVELNEPDADFTPSGQSESSTSRPVPDSSIISETHVLDLEPPEEVVLPSSIPNPPATVLHDPSPLHEHSLDDLANHEAPDNAVDLPRPNKLPKHDSGDVNDPSSRLFRRHLPDRASRHRAHYVCPTSATKLEAISNYLYLVAESDDRPYSMEMLVYESTISEVGRALVVTTTADMGDLIIPLSYDQAIASKESEYWQAAIQKELNGLIELGTFQYVRLADIPPNSNVMRCHMVFTIKRLEDGRIDKFKCRLVANGSTQRWGVDFDRVFSTVAKITTLRLVLAISAMRDYNLSSIDIRQAYLQATLNEDLYMVMPPGLPEYDSEGHKLVVKLLKSLYGLKQAGREWGQLLTKALLAWGMSQSAIDPCLFTYSVGNSILWVVVWVDDCVICDNDHQLRSRFVSYLSETFPVEDKGELNWILHVRVQRDRRSRKLSMFQDLYVKDLLVRFGGLLDGLTRRFDSPCDSSIHFSSDQCPDYDSVEFVQMSSHRKDYMSLVGAYLWLANVTRPELSYIAGQLARFVSNPSMLHYRAALRVLLYLKSTQSQALTFHPQGSESIRCFVDSNWSSDFSISGGVLDYMGCPIHWFSRTQKSVSMSSTEAEYFATCVAAREVIFVRELAIDLAVKVVGPTVIHTDNKGVVDLSLDPVAFKKTKHILRASHFVRDLVLRCAIKLEWICGKDNPADIFTKSHELATFRRVFRILMNLRGDS